MLDFIRRWRNGAQRDEQTLDKVAEVILSVRKLTILDARVEAEALLTMPDVYECVLSPLDDYAVVTQLSPSLQDLFSRYECIMRQGRLDIRRSYLKPIEWQPDFIRIGYDGEEVACALDDLEPIYLDVAPNEQPEATYPSIYHWLIVEYRTDPVVIDRADN